MKFSSNRHVKVYSFRRRENDGGLYRHERVACIAEYVLRSGRACFVNSQRIARAQDRRVLESIAALDTAVLHTRANLSNVKEIEKRG